MNKNISIGLNSFAKYMLLAVIGMALAGSTVTAQVKTAAHAVQAPGKSAASAKPVAFEVISLRPSKRGFFGSSPERETLAIQSNGYIAIDQPMGSTIIFAYLPRTWDSTPETAPMNEPSWVHDEYDIQAKVASADMAEWQTQGPQKEMLSAMLRSMLEDRCKLAMHWLPVRAPGYALVVARKHGPKLKKFVTGETIPPNGYPVTLGFLSFPGTKMFPTGGKDIPYYNVPMEVLAAWLARNLGVLIVDQTGLAGTYDFVLTNREMEDKSAPDPGPTGKWDLEALGLKLVPMKVPTRRLVIDHIERPSAN